MVAELVETNKLWARIAAIIEPDWVEPLAGHLVKYHYSEPHWSKKKQRCCYGVGKCHSIGFTYRGGPTS